MKKTLLFPGLLVLLSLCRLSAQEFAIRKIELAQGKVLIHYNLLDTVPHREYTVNVYSSLDNFVTPLQKVTGDHGLEVKPGSNKLITWDAPAELGILFNGKVTLEVRGRVFIPFIRLDNFDDYRSFKRGKSYTVSWTGGRSNNILNFDLYKGDKKITTFANIANSGNYALRFPTNVRPGIYTLKISDTRNKDDVVNTEPFKIRRKVPLLLKAVPVICVAALLSKLISAADEPEVEGPPNPNTIGN